jgi:hypothetical protein
MRALSRSFSKLAQLTFDQAFQWGAEPEDLARMNEILERAVSDMRATRKAARERRRSQRGERGPMRRGESRSRRGGKAEKGGEAEPAEED